MKKRVLGIILTAVLVTGILSGCSSGNSSGGGTAATTPPATETESDVADTDITEIAYPEKAIELIVPASPGGDTDFNARIMAKYLTAELGKAVVVVNVTGGGGSIGSDQVRTSSPDGYSLLFMHVPMHTNEAFGTTDYGFQDFETVSIVGAGTGELLVVRSDFPADNYEEFLAEVSSKPSEYKYGTSTGATSHFIGILLKEAGAEMNFVSTGSAADRIAGLAGGHLDVICSTYQGVKDYIESGEFKYIGVTSSERHPNFPDISTLKEQGLENLGADTLYTIYAPKGTDPAIVAKLNAACGNIIENNSEYQEEIFTAYSQSPLYYSTEDAISELTKQRDMFMSYSEQLKAGF